MVVRDPVIIKRGEITSTGSLYLKPEEQEETWILSEGAVGTSVPSTRPELKLLEEAISVIWDITTGNHRTTRRHKGKIK